MALLGVDGAGKTTVAHRLERELGLPVVYLYMGVSADSANRMLPTTRLVHAWKRLRGAEPDRRGPRDPGTLRSAPPSSPSARALRAAKSSLRLANRLAEEWYRQAIAWSHVVRGRVVVYDRHFAFDYHAYDVAGGPGLPLSRRIHGFVLARLYPPPDLVLILDAPPEVLLARKGEGTLESLARRRREYLDLHAASARSVLIDATLPLDDVVREAVAAVRGFAQARGLPAARAR